MCILSNITISRGWADSTWGSILSLKCFFNLKLFPNYRGFFFSLYLHFKAIENNFFFIFWTSVFEIGNFQKNIGEVFVTRTHHYNSQGAGGDQDCRRSQVTYQHFRNMKTSRRKHDNDTSPVLHTQDCFIKIAIHYLCVYLSMVVLEALLSS